MSAAHLPAVIIGAGPAGLAAAEELEKQNFDYLLLEASARPFGHCRSFQLDTVFFDEGPHISFSNNAHIKNVFAKNVSDRFLSLKPRMLNYWHGHWIEHPAQLNLRDLPPQIGQSLAADLTKKRNLVEAHNYREWLIQGLGEHFVNQFSEIYTRKYWTVPSEFLTYEWAGTRVVRPDAEQVQQGLDPKKPRLDRHYFSEFRYPEEGGFESFLRPFWNAIQHRARLNSRVVRIDERNQRVHLQSGEALEYSHLVSTMPLPEFIGMMSSAPSNVQQAAANLKATSVDLHSFVYHKGKSRPPCHWMYVYDEDIPFARAYWPHALTENMTDTVDAIQVEVYSSPQDRSRSQVTAEQIVLSLEKMGILDAKDILNHEHRFVKYANVLFDHDRLSNRTTIFNFLESVNNLWSIGRYGHWDYSWSDESLMQGYHAGKKIAEMSR